MFSTVFAQISTSARVAMVGVTRSVQTTLAPSCAAVTLDSNWLTMDKLALVRVVGLIITCSSMDSLRVSILSGFVL